MVCLPIEEGGFELLDLKAHIIFTENLHKFFDLE
jgi:hypothetical protein